MYGRVSVIIPAYRCGLTIGRAVESVLSQTVPPSEVLVVDDGSPEDLPSLIEPYAKHVTLIRKSNGGAASARNAGIASATGDFIAFIDADDYWERTKLEQQLRIFSRHPEVGIVASSFFLQSLGERRVAVEPTRLRTDEVLLLKGRQAFEAALQISTITVVVRRDSLGQERFDESLETAEDRDLWIRLLSTSPVFVVAAPLATAVLEPASLSRSNVACDCSNMLRVVRRNRGLLGWRSARMWESHTLYRWGACELRPGPALAKLAHSWLLWPLPFDRALVNQPLARVKAITMNLLRLLRLRRDRSGV